MKVLMFSTDSSILKSGSPAQRRMIEYGSLVEKLFIVVLLKKRVKRRVLDISPNVGVYSAYFWSTWNLGKKFKNQGINLVTAQDPFETGLIGYLAARRLKAKLQLQIHTDFLSPYFAPESLKNRVRVLLAKWLLPKADNIRVVHERIKKSLLESGIQVTESKIIVLPIFVDVKKIEAESIIVDLHKKYPQFDFILFMACRLEPEKDVCIVLDAMKEIIKKYPKTGLIIAGDGSLKVKLEKQVMENQLSHNIIFEGWIRDVSSYYKTADVFLNVSRYEGYGMGVIMSGASSTSIISTDVGLIGDIIINKDNSLIIPVGGVGALTNNILKLIENENLRQELSQKAKEAVQNLDTKESYLQKYKQSWQKALV